MLNSCVSRQVYRFTRITPGTTYARILICKSSSCEIAAGARSVLPKWRRGRRRHDVQHQRVQQGGQQNIPLVVPKRESEVKYFSQTSTKQPQRSTMHGNRRCKWFVHEAASSQLSNHAQVITALRRLGEVQPGDYLLVHSLLTYTNHEENSKRKDSEIREHRHRLLHHRQRH